MSVEKEHLKDVIDSFTKWCPVIIKELEESNQFEKIKDYLADPEVQKIIKENGGI